MNNLLVLSILTIFIITPTQSANYKVGGTLVFSDTNKPVYPATILVVSLLNARHYSSVTTNEQGEFDLGDNFPQGEFSLFVHYNIDNFYTEKSFISMINVAGDSYLELTFEAVSLNGTVVDAITNTPIQNCQLTAYSFYHQYYPRTTEYNFTTPINNEDGSFSGSIFPYFYTVYVIFNDPTDIAKYSPVYYQNDIFQWQEPQNTVIIAVSESSTISGTVRFQSDNTSIPNAIITFYPSNFNDNFQNGLPIITTTTDANGYFNATIPGDMLFFISINFNVSGPNPNSYFNVQGLQLGLGHHTKPGGSHHEDYVVHDDFFTGVVVDLNTNNTLSDQWIYGSAPFLNRDLGQANLTVAFESDSNGEFNVRMISQGYLLIVTNNELHNAALKMYDFDSGNTGGIVIQIPPSVHYSATVSLMDGSPLPENTRIIAYDSYHYAYDTSLIDSNGNIEFGVFDSLIYFFANYTWISPSNPDDFFWVSATYLSQIRFDRVPLINDTTNGYDYYYNAPSTLELKYVVLSGTIVYHQADNTTVPVAGAIFKGRNNFNFEDYSRFSIHSDANGQFSLHLAPTYYFDLEILPPPNSNYAITPAGDIYIEEDTSMTFVIQ